MKLTKDDEEIAELCVKLCELPCVCGHTYYRHNGSAICMVCACMSYRVADKQKCEDIESEIFAIQNRRPAVSGEGE